MRIDEMTPESTEDEMSTEMTSIAKQLQSGLISKIEAIDMMNALRDDLITRRALLDQTPEGTRIFLRIGLLIRMVVKFINDHP